jgi:hypothetical protein
MNHLNNKESAPERKFEKILSCDGYSIKKKRRRCKEKASHESSTYEKRGNDDRGAVLSEAT